MLFFVLLVVFLLEYTRPDQFLPFVLDLKLYTIAPLGLFLFAIAAKTDVANGEILSSNIGKLFLLLLFLAAISIPAALNIERAWEIWRALLGYLFLFFMVAKLCDNGAKLKWLFRILIGAHLWLIVQEPALLDQTERTYVNQASFLGDGNDFSVSILIVLPMCLYLFQTSRNRTGKFFYIVVMVVFMGAIMGAQSRGAFLALIAVVLYLWMQSRSKWIGTVLITVGLALFLAVASEGVLSRLGTITSYHQDGSAQSRLVAWEAGINMANRRFPVGVGPGNFPVAFGYWASAPGLPTMNAHSLYFQALGELGYVGLLALLWLLWVMYRDNQSIIKAISKDADEDRLDYRRLMIAVTGGLIAFSVAGAFLSVLYYPHLYVLAGIVFAARRAYQANDSKSGLLPIEKKASAPRKRWFGPDRETPEVNRKRSFRR